MLSVCRFCARWAEHTVEVDDIMLDNLIHAKDALRQMFGFELSYVPPFPNSVCPECVQYLQYSYIFHEQVQNAEKVFLALQKRDELTQRLSEMQSAGHVLQYEEIIEDEAHVSVVPANDVDENVESITVDRDDERQDERRDVAANEEDSLLTAQPSERVIEIKIEAMEELEIISSPLETVNAVIREPSSQDISNAADENHTPATESYRTNGSEGTKFERVDKSPYRKPMVEAVPPAQKANGPIVRNKCYVCYRMFGTEAELMAHLIEHNDLLPYRCQRCSTTDTPLVFRTNQALNQHLEAHSYPFACAECHLRFRKKSKITEHMRAIHFPKCLHTCKQCGTKFHELRKFCLHMDAHSKMETGRNQTTHNNTFERQRPIHWRFKPFYQCSHCNCGFKYHANYMAHLKLHQQTEKVFRCTEIRCRKNFTTFREWRRHMKLHFPDESIPFFFEMLPESLQDPMTYPKVCPEPACSYVAPALSQMYAHYYTHLKWFQCRQCDKQYATLSALRHHIELRHEGAAARRLEC